MTPEYAVIPFTAALELAFVQSVWLSGSWYAKCRDWGIFIGTNWTLCILDVLILDKPNHASVDLVAARAERKANHGVVVIYFV